jgi:integrase
MKIDGKAISGAKLPDGKADAIFWDSKVAGFGYRLRRHGAEVRGTYVYQYRINGRSHRYLIGKVEEITAAQARDQAEKKRAEVRLGHDPQQAKRDARRRERPHSMGAIVTGYRDETGTEVPGYLDMRKDELRARSYTEVARYLSGPKYFGPLHRADIGNVSRRDVAACLNTIIKSKGKVAAARARTALSGFFTWALQQGIVEANPVTGTAVPNEPEPRDRVLTDAELIAIWKAADDSDFGKIVRLLITLASRRSEIGSLRFSEIDFDAGTWTLPKERSKNGKAHTLPLHATALNIIRSVPCLAGRDLLFGAHSKEGFTAWRISKEALDRRAGIADWRLHDLRRTAATRMADIGIAPHIIEEILNHKSGHRAGPAGIYNRSSYTREVRAALACWDAHVHSLVMGEAPKVVSIAERAAG